MLQKWQRLFYLSSCTYFDIVEEIGFEVYSKNGKLAGSTNETLHFQSILPDIN